MQSRDVLVTDVNVLRILLLETALYSVDGRIVDIVWSSLQIKGGSPTGIADMEKEVKRLK